MDDLTPNEIIMVARVINLVPDLAVIQMPDNDQMGLLTSHPDFTSLVEKVTKALGDKDVKKALDKMEGRD